MALPENAVKELLSRGFLRLVAAPAGFVASSHESDWGVDLTLSQIHCIRTSAGAERLTPSGFTIDVQLKATCRSNIVEDADGLLPYDLDARNYNDLVRRRDGPRPMILVLFVLPDERDTWLALADSELTLRRCGYYWRPSDADAKVSNLASKRIRIPTANRVTASTLDALRQEYQK